MRTRGNNRKTEGENVKTFILQDVKEQILRIYSFIISNTKEESIHSVYYSPTSL